MSFNFLQIQFRAFFCLFLLLFALPENFYAEDNLVEINGIKAIETDQSLNITIQGSKPLISMAYELPAPQRIIVDISDAHLAADFSNQLSSNFVSLSTKDIKDIKPAVLRFEFTLTGKASFESKPVGNNIQLTINKIVGNGNGDHGNASTKDSIKVGVLKEGDKNPDKLGSLIGGAKRIDTHLPDINPLEAKLSPKGKEQQMEDAFNFSGYNKDRITVEFQKMDLHNVFNFLRQVSGVNIVVDESVQGSLTLVLDDVPWDFALDVILNLKDLAKEERFNTLVIYPKNKAFKWPDQAKNNLSFQADSKVVEQEALVIKQQSHQSSEPPEARELILKANDHIKQENFEVAAQLYEKALVLWPANANLALQISSLYLVQLQQNAKALYYAKIVLNKEPRNTSALLNAAIASANMQDKNKAKYYFNQCTQVKKPIKEALLNAAAFDEQEGNLSGALAMLERHDALYGQDLNSMVATARICDKMGRHQLATEKYNSIVLSGYELPPDLARFIAERVGYKKTM